MNVPGKFQSAAGLLDRISYRVFMRTSTLGRRLNRRLTRPGMAVAGGIGVTAMLGLDTEQSFAYQSFAFLACLFVVSSLSVPFFRARFGARRLLPEFGSVGERFLYRVRVRNDSGRLQRGLVLTDRTGNDLPTFDEFLRASRSARRRRRRDLTPIWTGRATVRESPLPAIPPGEEVETQVEVIPRRRGPLRFEAVTIACSDPIGLIRGFARVPLPQTVLILPRRYQVPPVTMPGTVKHQPGGVALASSVGESQEYVFLRDYRRGDPMRHVHWKSWAKTGKLIVKEFQNEFFVRHALVLDTFSEREEEEVFEEAVSLAASYACTIQTQESLLDLMFVGTEAFCFTAGRGLARTEQILEVLASVQSCRTPKFELLQDLVLDHSARLSGCICIFQEWNQPRKTLVKRLEAIGVPLMILVVTRPGESLPSGDDRPENFHHLEAGRIEEGLRRMSTAPGRLE